ncbi:MAG: glycosyltransferase family 39 protein [Candidatus Aminicenantales bacterium]
MKFKNALAGKSVLWILILAAFIRVWGINWSLPFTFHVDENWFAQKAVNIYKGDLNPHFFHVPTLHMYMLAGILRGYYLAGKFFGKFHSPAEFMENLAHDQTVFYTLGRLLSALLSLGTILLVYLIGMKMYNRRAGALAALFLIFSPEYNKVSHDMVPDGPMLFFFMLAFYFVWQVYKSGKTKYYILAGLVAGLGSAVKYGGQMIFIPLFLAHVFYILEKGLPKKDIFLSPKLVGSAFFFILGFLAGCPYAVLDFRIFWRDFRWQSEHLYKLGHFGSSSAQPAWLFYILYGFRENIGLIFQFFALGGLVYGFVRRRKREMILFSLPLVLFFIIGTWKTRATRYFLPLAPFFILIASSFLDRTLSYISLWVKRWSGKNSFRLKGETLLASAAVLLVILPQAFQVARFDYTLTQPDTRTIAKDWIHHYIPARTKIALEEYGPPISRQKYRVLNRITLSEVGLEWLSRRKVRLAVISDIIYARFTRFPDEFPKEARFYRSLDQNAVLVKTIKPKWDEYLLDLHNPTLKIYFLSSMPNAAFPGNFTRYAQSLSLDKAPDGGWTLSTSLSADGRVEAGEKVKNPYVRVTDTNGREIARIIVHEGEMDAPDGSVYAKSAKIPSLPAGSRVYIGYEYALFPNPFDFEPESVFAKESLALDKIESKALEKGNMRCDFYYAAFPNTHGDNYFQSVFITRKAGAVLLKSAAFGGELRWGEGYVLNPFVLIQDRDGKEIKKIFLYNGKVGSVEAQRKGPVEKTSILPALSDGYKVFVGYDYYFDKEHPDLAGGPELIEISPRH